MKDLDSTLALYERGDRLDTDHGMGTVVDVRWREATQCRGGHYEYTLRLDKPIIREIKEIKV